LKQLTHPAFFTLLSPLPSTKHLLITMAIDAMRDVIKWLAGAWQSLNKDRSQKNKQINKSTRRCGHITAVFLSLFLSFFLSLTSSTYPL
jgi:hypothetical protein